MLNYPCGDIENCYVFTLSKENTIESCDGIENCYAFTISKGKIQSWIISLVVRLKSVNALPRSNVEYERGQRNRDNSNNAEIT